mmetsp:Transcript_30701/g.76816  ORF Transcript_30701/g.76816 Transcript_30701/m.76816 type:complete len:290 (+) Transcript_30701:78-947(+)
MWMLRGGECGVVESPSLLVARQLGRDRAAAIGCVETERRAVLHLGRGRVRQKTRVGDRGRAVVRLQDDDERSQRRQVDPNRRAALHRQYAVYPRCVEARTCAGRLRARAEDEEGEGVGAREERERGEVPQRHVRHAPFEQLAAARVSSEVDRSVAVARGESERREAGGRPVAVLGRARGVDDRGELERLEHVLPVGGGSAVAANGHIDPMLEKLAQRQHARAKSQIANRAVDDARTALSHELRLVVGEPARVRTRGAREGEEAGLCEVGDSGATREVLVRHHCLRARLE